MHATALLGGNLVLEHGVVERGALIFAEGRVLYAGPETEVPKHTTWDLHTIAVDGAWIFPGFIDLHIHGGGGSDTMDGCVDALRQIARTHGAHGTTGFLPTTMTARHEDVLRATEAVSRAVDDWARAPWTGAKPLGMHLEGPYINPARAGAQDPALMRPADLDELRSIMRALGDNLKVATLAPELPGGMEALHFLTSQGVVVSLGHTDATCEEAQLAFRAGASQVTHMFNGMRGIHHRDPGIAGAALLDDSVMCEVIADGIHLHPDAIRLIVQAKGPAGCCLITDAIEATDMPDGQYELGGLEVTVRDGACRLAGGSLAGSILTMDRAVGYLVQTAGLPVHIAARMAALNPARQLRLADRKGRLRVGYDADITLLDGTFHATHTWVEGRPIFPQ